MYAKGIRSTRNGAQAYLSRVDQGEQIEAFAHELDKLVDRFCDEYDVPYASVVGVLHFKTKLLMDDWEKSHPAMD